MNDIARLTLAGLICAALLAACARPGEAPGKSSQTGQEPAAAEATSSRPAENGSADRGLVVGTTGAAAVQAGVDVLKAGGSAMDAALATAMAQVTLAAGSWVSFAGLMTLVYYDAGTDAVYNMNASYNTVAGEDDPMSIPGIDMGDFMSTEIRPSGRATL
ncbi:MAG: hypothetical protein OXQ29_12960, partial [Rhodospirillaceae bacterium]|nr:hypothetical protein [Rhodospirillaceae bacterium]